MSTARRITLPLLLLVLALLLAALLVVLTQVRARALPVGESAPVLPEGGESEPLLLTSDRVPIDLVLVVDASASLRQTDPHHLRLTGGRMLTDLMHDDDRLALLTFGHLVRMLSPLATIGESGAREELKTLLHRASADEPWTDLEPAIRQAIRHLRESGDPSHRRYILLLGDGGISLAGGPKAERASRETLLRGMLGQARREGIVCYSAGFSADIDAELMRALVNRTRRPIAGKMRGLAETVKEPQAVAPAFARLYANMDGQDSAQGRGILRPGAFATPGSRKAGGRGTGREFPLDADTAHATFTITKDVLRAEGRRGVELRIPGVSSPLTREAHAPLPPGSTWRETAAYAIISVPFPEPGLYGVQAGRGATIQCFIQRPDLSISAVESTDFGRLWPLFQSAERTFSARSYAPRPVGFTAELRNVRGLSPHELAVSLPEARDGTLTVPAGATLPFQVEARHLGWGGLVPHSAGGTLQFRPAHKGGLVFPRGGIPIALNICSFLLTLLLLLLLLLLLWAMIEGLPPGVTAWLVWFFLARRATQMGRVIVSYGAQQQEHRLRNLLGILPVSRRIRLESGAWVKVWLDRFDTRPSLSVEVHSSRGDLPQAFNLLPGESRDLGHGYSLRFEMKEEKLHVRPAVT